MHIPIVPIPEHMSKNIVSLSIYSSYLIKFYILEPFYIKLRIIIYEFIKMLN